MEVDNTRGGTVSTPNTPNAADPNNASKYTGSGARDKRGDSTTKGLSDEVNKGMRKYLISDKMIELLNNQLQDEMINHNLYRLFALYYHNKGLVDLAEYFELRAKEELLHHEWIYGYLAYCGIVVQYPEIPAINADILDELEPFKLTVDKEIETTRYINEIAKQALADGDFGTFAWLNGNGPVDGELIPEQTEEMSVSNDVLRIAMQDDGWLSKGDAILDFYKDCKKK